MDYPKQALPILPLKNTVLFPHISMPLVVNRPMSVAALEQALASEDKFIGVFTQRESATQTPTTDDLFDTGTLAVIKKMVRTNQGLHIEVQGVTRITTTGRSEQKPWLNDVFHYLPDPSGAEDDTKTEALHRAVMELADKLIRLVQPETQLGLNYIIGEIEDPVKQIYLLTTVITLDVAQEIELLSALTKTDLYQAVHSLLEHEVQILELRNQINSQVASKLGKDQREYLLRQQLRAIQDELGETMPEQAEAAELRDKRAEADLPDLVGREVDKELERLERMPPASPDYQLTRTWLELVLALPWRKTTTDLLDLEHAQRILDEDHFNLIQIKERIIEHLAVMKLNPGARAPILCFVGPPGVGKTSLGQSIARAMGREFERMSLGGLHDEAELRGHRRTYIGAMPGRVLQAIRRAKVSNPLLMLDEIDKLGRDFRGDPAAALMEILDPAQNREFHDNYLDLPFDLSGVFFIATANTLENIPMPLLDRMEVLRLAGYSNEEKAQIARQYLIPRQLAEAGLTAEQLVLSDDTLVQLIARYTREAGVRGLERTLAKLARKIASQVARGEPGAGSIETPALPELLGPEPFRAEQARQQLVPGVVAGLAWTEAGGEVLYVEAVLLAGGKELQMTGQLGSVMQESAKAAHSYLWSHADNFGIDRDKIRQSGSHIHVPSGAVPKDGPSAGVAMACALASLYTDIPARSDTAMTGEITLSGLVLPVGGIKEKVLAAYRAGILRVVLPEENRKDLVELPEHVLARMEIIHVDRIDAALAAVIPGVC